MVSATGTYQHSIDAKGRLFVPAKLRDVLGECFYLAMGTDACLAIYPQSTWDKFTARYEALPMSKAKALRNFFARAEQCTPDSQGRIVLPQRLRTYAQLNKDCVIAGVHDHAEIWDATRWDAQEAEMTPEKMDAAWDDLSL